MPNSVAQWWWWCTVHSSVVRLLPPTIGQQIAVTINRTMQMRPGTLTMPIKSQCRWWWRAQTMMQGGELDLDSRPFPFWLSVSIISEAFILHPLLKSKEQGIAMGLANRLEPTEATEATAGDQLCNGGTTQHLPCAWSFIYFGFIID